MCSSIFYRELQKNYSHRTPTWLSMASPTDGVNSNVCDCQTAWSVDTITDGITNRRGKSNAPVLWPTVTNGFAGGLRKIWRDFQNFNCEFQKILTEFNSTCQKNIILCSVGKSIGKTVVWNQPPLRSSFSHGSPNFFSSLLSLHFSL